jgi:uncharacterized membrane protein
MMPAAAPVAAPRRARIDSVDWLRGLVMVLMALDHARDFFMGFSSDPTNLATTTVPLFFTRWITHFCAPVFMLLAGTGAYLSRKPTRDLSWFLLTRGLWLVVLEVTLVHLAWTFDPLYHFSVFQVIWALGWSMVALAALVWLPLWAIVAFGAAMVLGHDALDGVHATRFGAVGGVLWHVLHEQGKLIDGTHRLIVIYPLVPWIGVMALGYGLGAVIADEKRRRARLFALGGALTAAFVLLRASNLYGDPGPWSAQPRAAFTLLSFLRCEKYPPSLCYLLMTLGPALIALALVERHAARSRVLVIFGRVPLFYYVAHIFLLHVVEVGNAAAHGLRGIHALLPDEAPHYGLPTVYAVWAAAVVVLYWPSRWYDRVKRQSRNPLLSYL